MSACCAGAATGAGAAPAARQAIANFAAAVYF